MGPKALTSVPKCRYQVPMCPKEHNMDSNTSQSVPKWCPVSLNVLLKCPNMVPASLSVQSMCPKVSHCVSKSSREPEIDFKMS